MAHGSEKFDGANKSTLAIIAIKPSQYLRVNAEILAPPRHRPIPTKITVQPPNVVTGARPQSRGVHPQVVPQPGKTQETLNGGEKAAIEVQDPKFLSEPGSGLGRSGRHVRECPILSEEIPCIEPPTTVEAEPDSNQWDDLDAEDADDPVMVSEYVNEIFTYLKEVEASILSAASLLFFNSCRRRRPCQTPPIWTSNHSCSGICGVF